MAGLLTVSLGNKGQAAAILWRLFILFLLVFYTQFRLVVVVVRHFHFVFIEFVVSCSRQSIGSERILFLRESLFARKVVIFTLTAAIIGTAPIIAGLFEIKGSLQERMPSIFITAMISVIIGFQRSRVILSAIVFVPIGHQHLLNELIMIWIQLSQHMKLII